MATKSSTWSGVARHLHEMSLADRLISGESRVLRRLVDGALSADALAVQTQSRRNEERVKQQEAKRAQAAQKRLEKAMAAMTNSELLRVAKMDQRGTKYIPDLCGCYIELLTRRRDGCRPPCLTLDLTVDQHWLWSLVFNVAAERFDDMNKSLCRRYGVNW